MWLGKSDVSDCHLVCTSSGRLVVARSVRRTTCAYDPSLVGALRDTPDQHVSFLAGRVGASRNQLRPKPVESENHGSGSEVLASDPPSENEDVIESPHDIAPAPSSVRLPSEAAPKLPPAPARESSQAPVYVPPPESALSTSGPRQPETPTPNPSLGLGLGPGQPVTPEGGIGETIFDDEVDVGMSEAAPLPDLAGATDYDRSESKRQRIRAVNAHHRSDEVVCLENLDLGSNADLEEVVDESLEQPSAGNFEDASNIPKELWRPFGAGEPQLAKDELALIDGIAESFELPRLESMGVLERLPAGADLSGYKRLSTKMVKSWRIKPSPTGGGEAFLRRACGTRHISGRVLWLQDFLFKWKKASLHAVPTSTNPADFFAKSLSGTRIRCLSNIIGVRDASDGFSLVGAAELEEQRRRDQAKKFLRAVKSTGRGNAEALQLLTMLIQLVGTKAAVTDDRAQFEPLLVPGSDFTKSEASAGSQPGISFMFVAVTAGIAIIVGRVIANMTVRALLQQVVLGAFRVLVQAGGFVRLEATEAEQPLLEELPVEQPRAPLQGVDDASSDDDDDMSLGPRDPRERAAILGITPPQTPPESDDSSEQPDSEPGPRDYGPDDGWRSCSC